ncbi:MAG TPA: SHOCT domain-containing protein [Candidatus Dormibacteraeota bacterium]|nr:SHOCT domain-containing protein [Candidatus Dormibacteraeota bacterium]
MMWYWTGNGGMWLAGIVMTVVLWGAIIAFIVVLLRSMPQRKTDGADAALATLRRRLASGEITSDEFERLRKVLQG